MGGNIRHEKGLITSIVIILCLISRSYCRSFSYRYEYLYSQDASNVNNNFNCLLSEFQSSGFGPVNQVRSLAKNKKLRYLMHCNISSPTLLIQNGMFLSLLHQIQVNADQVLGLGIVVFWLEEDSLGDPVDLTLSEVMEVLEVRVQQNHVFMFINF